MNRGQRGFGPLVFDPGRLFTGAMKVREARPEEAEEACSALSRSIIELCATDHRHHLELLAAWLANKTPGTVAAWMRRADASYLLAIDRGAIAAVGAVTDGGEILLNYVSAESRFRGVGHALLAALEARAEERGATRCTLVSTETAYRFSRAREYEETGAPTRIFGMDSGYPMEKALASPACDGGPAACRAGEA